MLRYAKSFFLLLICSLMGFSSVATSNNYAVIGGVIPTNSTAFKSDVILSSYFDLIGNPADPKNKQAIADRIVQLYIDQHYYPPVVEIVSHPTFSNIFRAVISEPVFLSFDVEGGSSEARASAASFLSSLLGSYIVNEKEFDYLADSLRGRLGVGVKIEPAPFDKVNGGFHVVVKLVGSINSIISLSNEGVDSLGKEVVSAEVQFVEQVPGFKRIYINTFDTISTNGYRSVGAGFVSAVNSQHEFLLNANISRARFDDVFDNSYPQIEYDRTELNIGWQYQLLEKKSISNSFFTGIALKNLTREQFVEDINEKLRIVELGYWQQNIWKNNTLYWSAKIEKGLDSAGAVLEGALSDSNIEIDYSLINLNLIYNQPLPWNFSARIDLNGQYSNDNVPYSERFTIASNSMARAFESGEISGDSGAGLKLEINQGNDLALLSSRWVPYGYYGVGKVKDNVSNATITAASAGIGFRWFNQTFSFYAEIGKPLLEESIYRTDTQRVKAGMSVWF